MFLRYVFRSFSMSCCFLSSQGLYFWTPWPILMKRLLSKNMSQSSLPWSRRRALRRGRCHQRILSPHNSGPICCKSLPCNAPCRHCIHLYVPIKDFSCVLLLPCWSPSFNLSKKILLRLGSLCGIRVIYPHQRCSFGRANWDAWPAAQRVHHGPRSTSGQVSSWSSHVKPIKPLQKNTLLRCLYGTCLTT